MHLACRPKASIPLALIAQGEVGLTFRSEFHLSLLTLKRSEHDSDYRGAY